MVNLAANCRLIGRHGGVLVPLPHARGFAGGALAWILPFADTGSPMPFSLDFSSLRRSYAERAASPIAVAREIAARIRARGEDAVWISRVAEDALLAAAAALERRAATEGLAAMPLYGLPFTIKDNIDVAGLPTTAACPGFAYPPQRSAPAVERLLAAGALLIGKTNLDQFATGLVGTRSPYGVPPNPFDPALNPGGSGRARRRGSRRRSRPVPRGGRVAVPGRLARGAHGGHRRGHRRQAGEPASRDPPNHRRR